jgi:hypothetical protein
MIGQFLGWIGGFFKNLATVIFGWISNLLGYLFQKLFDLLKLLFDPILIVIAMLFYFIQKLGTIVVLLFQSIMGIGKLFISLVKGIITTIAGFTFTPAVRSDGKWTNIFSHISEGLGFFQLDNVAYILMFVIWFGTAFAAIRILTSAGGSAE